MSREIKPFNEGADILDLSDVVLPSAADLDAVAAEEQVKLQTGANPEEPSADPQRDSSLRSE